MSVNDQADGFFELEKYQCPRCLDLPECACTCKPRMGQSRDRSQEQQHDVTRQMQYPIAHRLTRGFAIMGGNKHDL